MLKERFPRLTTKNGPSLRCGAAASLVVMVAFGIALPACGAELKCSSDFEGGSGDVLSIDQEQRMIRITPTFHKDRGWPCWWYVHVSGIEAGETIVFELVGPALDGVSQFALPRRMTFSLDNRIWQQASPGKDVADRTIRWTLPIDAAQAWFAWGPPFVPSDAQRLVDEVARNHPFATAYTLCKTREGRPVPALRIEERGDGEAPRYGIWINARQHAWESGSSWVCRGLVEWLVSEEARAQRLRRQAVVYVAPIMDIDNTFRGAGGKGQKPHDHNRDWSDDAHWPSVRAAMEQIRALDARGQFDLFLDLHNPGRGDREPFFFAAPPDCLSELGLANHRRFMESAQAEIVAPMKLRTELRFTGANYDAAWKRISKCWVAAHTGKHVVALCLETPWDTPHSTVQGYQSVGRQLGLSIERYLRTDPRRAP